MPLPTQNIDIPFSGGLDTKTDPNLVSPPALLQLQNGVFTQGGTIVKRNGFAQLGQTILGGSSLTTGKALGVFNDELLQFTSDGTVYSYAENLDQWVSKGSISPLTITDRQIIRNNYTQSNPDMDTANGVTVVAWEDGRGGIRASAYDEATQAALLSDVSITTTGKNPRVVGVGQTLCLVYADSSALKMVTLSTISPSAFSSVYTVDSSMPGSGARIDAHPVDHFCFLAAWNFSGQTRVAYILPSGVTGSPATGYPSPVNVAMGCTASVDLEYDIANGLIWLLGASGSGLYGATLTTNFAAGVAPVQIDASASVSNVTGVVVGTTETVAYEITGSASYNSVVWTNTMTSAGVIGGASVGLRSVGLACKSFALGGDLYVGVVFSSPLQPTFFLAKMASTWTIVGKGNPYVAGGLFSAGVIPKAVTISATDVAIASPTRVQLVNQVTNSAGSTTTYTSYFLVGIDRVDFAFNSVETYRSVQMGGNLLITGGVLQSYDGQSVVEHGFHLYPESFTAVASASGGSMADGTYGITVVWYWQDAQGQLHRSAPGVPISVTITGGGGAGSIALTIPTLRITSKTGTRTNVIAAVFRTPANGTLYQRVGNGANDPVLTPVYNDPTADTISFSLTTNDAQIAANEILYTTGGSLGDFAPESASLIAASRDRVFLAGCPGAPNTFFYSQQYVPGGAVRFSPFLYGTVDPQAGDITAMAVMDASVVLFKERSIYVMQGDGPDQMGSNNAFTTPQLVTSDVGCVEPESLAISPVGLLFKSHKGIYLLDRSLSVSYKGAPVERYNANNITGGVLADGVNQIRFTTSDGPALVWDYYFNQWGTWVNTSGEDGTFVAADAINWKQPGTAESLFVYLDTAGRVWQETPGIYLDNNNPVALYLKTAWIKVGALQGFVKIPWVTLLGQFFSDHILRIGVAYDFQGYISEIHLFDSGLGMETYGTDTYGTETPYGGVTNTVYQARFRPDTMKCEAIQFTFAEQSPSNGEGFAISGLTLTAAMTQAPFRKLPAGQTLASS